MLKQWDKIEESGWSAIENSKAATFRQDFLPYILIKDEKRQTCLINIVDLSIMTNMKVIAFKNIM